MSSPQMSAYEQRCQALSQMSEKFGIYPGVNVGHRIEIDQ